MFNLGFLWLALSIGSEITGTSMIKKTNGFSKLAPSALVVCAYGMCYFALTRASILFSKTSLSSRFIVG